ncbi:MAG: hypothetical protein IPM48_13385 [Saprospiraceae bacterium]|nr:hypothetical protein [Saprospiraceae bacterium]
MVVWISYKNPKDNNLTFFLLTGLIFLSTIDFLLFEISNYLKKSNNPYHFTRFFMAMVFGKMMLFVFFIVLGVVKYALDKRALISPLLIFYIIFTIHETYYLILISKRN